MSDFENSSEINLGTLFYSRQAAASGGATEGFHKAAYGGILSHRFNHKPLEPVTVQLVALAGLGEHKETMRVSAPQKSNSTQPL